MNIFFLSRDPKQAARYHCDRHVTAMVREYAQLMSTAHVLAGSAVQNAEGKWTNEVGPLWAPTHSQHPCALWVRSSALHYRWLYHLWLHVLYEYEYRYGSKRPPLLSWKGILYTHQVARLIASLEKNPSRLDQNGWSEPPQAMPDKFRVKGDSLTAYRRLYKVGKSHLHAWTGRSPPPFVL